MKGGVWGGGVEWVGVGVIVEGEGEMNGFSCEGCYKVVGIFKEGEGGVVGGRVGKGLKRKEEGEGLVEKWKDGRFKIKDISRGGVKKWGGGGFRSWRVEEEGGGKVGYRVGERMMIGEGV